MIQFAIVRPNRKGLFVFLERKHSSILSFNQKAHYKFKNKKTQRQVFAILNCKKGQFGDTAVAVKSQLLLGFSFI